MSDILNIQKIFLDAPVTVIGDVHGKVDQYWKLLSKLKSNTIQVGDFGFINQHLWHQKNIDGSKHKINFGNHDDTEFLDADHSLGDCSIINENIFTIRGARSEDRQYRKAMVDWWPNEELSDSQFYEIMELYKKTSPEIVITHDCPREVSFSLFGITSDSRTSIFLQKIFEIHQPKLWLFGHHHKSKTLFLGDTKFMCLNELETTTIKY